MNFHVGQQVVCVDDSPSIRGTLPLTKGCVYTVRDSNAPNSYDSQPCIRVAEIVRPKPDFGFWAHRFRPVKQTSIEIFEKLLAPTPRETEPA